MLVGDPDDKIVQIAVCLDPTVDAVKIAAEGGCNLLLTHHPAYLGEIQKFMPGKSVADVDGALVGGASLKIDSYESLLKNIL